MTERTQGVFPMLAYEDAGACMDWLANAFGFKELKRIRDNNGRVTHGEMETGHGIVMLANPTPDYQSPKNHRSHCEPARKWAEVPYIIDGVMVYVNDINTHFKRAKQSGAVILSEPEENPFGKLYRCEDVEGHRWMFMQLK